MVLRKLEAELRFFAAGEMLAAVDLDAHAAGCEAFLPAFAAMLDDARGGDRGLVDLKARLHAFATERGEEFAGFFSLALSSLVSMLRLAAFFASRIPDADERQAFVLHFLDGYLERATVLAGEAAALLRSYSQAASAENPVEACA
jgi:hypothetical protein